MKYRNDPNRYPSDSIPHGMRGYKSELAVRSDLGRLIASLMGCEDINFEPRLCQRDQLR